MSFICRLLVSIFLMIGIVFATETDLNQSSESIPTVASWMFSGIVTNEAGEQLGYFFQMQRQGLNFHTKTALIDGQTNKLVFFYEGQELLTNTTEINWHVGSSFMRYNSINDSWIFGVKMENKQGFNFKVDLLKQANENKNNVQLKPGVSLQALETTRLNGHIQSAADNKEQFVTGNKTWFAKIWLSEIQAKKQAINTQDFSLNQSTPLKLKEKINLNLSHTLPKMRKDHTQISTAFCRLNNENGFYAANRGSINDKVLKVGGWCDASGTKLKLSKFISIKSLTNNEYFLHIGSTKFKMKFFNTLNNKFQTTASLAGFSTKVPQGFCFIEEQSFFPLS